MRMTRITRKRDTMPRLPCGWNKRVAVAPHRRCSGRQNALAPHRRRREQRPGASRALRCVAATGAHLGPQRGAGLEGDADDAGADDQEVEDVPSVAEVGPRPEPRELEDGLDAVDGRENHVGVEGDALPGVAHAVVLAGLRGRDARDAHGWIWALWGRGCRYMRRRSMNTHVHVMSIHPPPPYIVSP